MSAAGADATAWGGPHGAEARDPRLDGLRGLAIALVMLYHTTQFAFARGPLAEALVLAPSVGWSGVDLFFVLSGFLITGILLRAKRSSSYYGAFYARRVLRIFPLYYAVLVFFLIVVPRLGVFASVNDLWQEGSDRNGLWFWLYLSNLRVAWTGAWQHHALDITWSLAIEEHFYLLWPLVVRSCGERALLRVCAATALAALGLRVALVASGAAPAVAYVLTPCRLDTLATGAALAILARRHGLAALAPWARRVLPAALALFAACYAFARVGAGAAPTAADYAAATEHALGFTTHPLVQTVGYTLLCAIYGALLVIVAAAPAGSPWARVFELRWLRSLGTYSYALYLFHFFVGMLAVGLPWTPARNPQWFVPAQLALWATAIAASYGLARLSWALLEAPMLSLKRHFPYRV
jgi:peptidoglycan/LPS O-acetylase OafA/YrhL